MQSLIETLKNNHNFIKTTVEDNSIVEYLSFDSRDIKANTLFFCKGEHFHVNYLQSALESGAIVYLGEKIYPEVFASYILVHSVREAMAQLAKFFYDSPDERIKIIGITGTKGKSTTANYIQKILENHARKTHSAPPAYINSVEVFDGKNTLEATLTTPEVLDVYKYLHQALLTGCQYMVMEISSQALKYSRIEGVNVDLGILLNIDQDHISPNEHPTLEDYVASKLKIFEYCKHSIVNQDMKYFQDILEKSITPDYTFSLEQEATIQYLSSRVEDQHQLFSVLHNHHQEQYRLASLGEFNISNAMAAILAAKHYNIGYDTIYEALSSARLSGRMNLYTSDDNNRICLVDYAHNALSYQKVFESVNHQFSDYYKVVIFGCPGNKALTRRKDLPELTDSFADEIYLCDEDPAYEDPQLIIEQIQKYIQKTKTHVINSRKEAIKTAFKNSPKRTILLILGKGEETFQKVNGKYEPYEGDHAISQELIQSYNQENQ